MGIIFAGVINTGVGGTFFSPKLNMTNVKTKDYGSSELGFTAPRKPPLVEDEGNGGVKIPRREPFPQSLFRSSPQATRFYPPPSLGRRNASFRPYYPGDTAAYDDWGADSKGSLRGSSGRRPDGEVGGLCGVFSGGCPFGP